MSDKTGIEWTDATWNPVTGCTKVSPGCDNCYAETFAERWRGIPGHHFENGFDVQLRPDKLDQPLKWKKPRKIFVNSMSDLFHQDVPDEYIARVFAVMALTPQHTYQLLTKRHGRMRSLLSRSGFFDEVRETAHHDHYMDLNEKWFDRLDRRDWPLSNVWLGVSVEDQKRADLRIPALIETPAAVRFLSCEPLLGPVDLTTWMPPTSPMQPSAAPKSWADWVWPEFVPIRVREQIQDFWSEDWGRGPRAWLANMSEQGAPPFGAVVTMGNGFGPNPEPVTGRYVHAWNNIGRLVLDDGEFAYTSFSTPEVRRLRNIDWVIVGGESGRNARPMHQQWARDLRDQCQNAGVAFLFKQWGEWGPAPWKLAREAGESDDAYKARSNAEAATHSYAPWAHEYDHFVNEGHPAWGGERATSCGPHAPIRRWGKKRAGRELDGRTWDEYPQAVTR
jgi:protein gp37